MPKSIGVEFVMHGVCHNQIEENYETTIKQKHFKTDEENPNYNPLSTGDYFEARRMP